jgi:hypothetical protein
MKKYFALLILSGLFNTMNAQTPVGQKLQAAEPVQKDNLQNSSSVNSNTGSNGVDFTALLNLVKNSNRQQYTNNNLPATYNVPGNGDCVWCILNVNRRVQNDPVKNYTARCAVNFLPGFETVPGDNFDISINPDAIMCDTLPCTIPDIITGAPALVKNEIKLNYPSLFTYFALKPTLYNKNYLKQYKLQ